MVTSPPGVATRIQASPFVRHPEARAGNRDTTAVCVNVVSAQVITVHPGGNPESATLAPCVS